MRLKAPKSSGIRAQSSGSVGNPNPRERGEKEGAVGERVRTGRAQHSKCGSKGSSQQLHKEERRKKKKRGIWVFQGDRGI
jgi:hypothetical protein